MQSCDLLSEAARKQLIRYKIHKVKDGTPKERAQKAHELKTSCKILNEKEFITRIVPEFPQRLDPDEVATVKTSLYFSTELDRNMRIA